MWVCESVCKGINHKEYHGCIEILSTSLNFGLYENLIPILII